MKDRSALSAYQAQLNELSKGEKLISGIYNYCDRWCERCSMANHCSIYYMELSDNQPQNGKNIDRINEIFTLTMEMLHEISEEMGIKLSELPEIDIPEHQPTDVEKHAIDLDRRFHLWMVQQESDLAHRLQLLQQTDAHRAKTLKNAIEIVEWHMNLVGPKLHRAMTVIHANDFNEVELLDRRGSAKVALISIDKCTGAFGYLLKQFPHYETEILGFLSQLSSIKKLLLATFPDAMDFKRPGFDE
jgi:hypothetical protein